MKKYIFTLILLLMCHWGHSQSINALFDEFKNEPNAEYINASPLLMAIGKLFIGNGKLITDDDEGVEIAKKIRSAKIMDMEDCSKEVQNRFKKRVGTLKTKGYETLVRINDEGDKMHILMKMKKDVIRELLLVFTGDDDCNLIQINGKFTKKDIDNLINQQIGQKHGRR